jgi:hypothetical protein
LRSSAPAAALNASKPTDSTNARFIDQPLVS